MAVRERSAVLPGETLAVEARRVAARDPTSLGGPCTPAEDPRCSPDRPRLDFLVNRRGATSRGGKQQTMSGRRTTGVWISADSATVVHWSPQVRMLRRIVAPLSGRRRSSGRAPTEPHPAGEGHRDEHMRTFFDAVACALAGGDDLLLVGDGEVVDHFAAYVRALDARLGPPRRIVVEKSGPLTDRQLLGRLRAFAGSPARRTPPR